ncbi:MAG: hypothetical protein ABSG54_15920 [Terriglobia bacterium]|jgi:hypothetical protein
MTENEKHEIVERVLDEAEKIENALYVFHRAEAANRLGVDTPAEERYPFLAFSNVIAAVLTAIDPTMLEGVDLEDKLSDALPTDHPEYRLPQGHRTLLRYRQEEHDYFAAGPGEGSSGGYLCGDTERPKRRTAEKAGEKYYSPYADLPLIAGEGGEGNPKARRRAT